MNFYYLKLGKKNCEAEEWLSHKNKMGSPHAFIYFDNLKEKDYRNKKAKKQALEFYRIGSEKNQENNCFIVIYDGYLNVLKPHGPIKFLRSTWNDQKPPKRHRRKVIPVKVLKKIFILDLPLVLAGMPSNQSLARGTFQKITDQGNLLALKLLIEDDKEEGNTFQPLDACSFFECLSSTELETLVAKCLEELGCFVPAHLGGNLKGIDLLASKETSGEIKFCEHLLKNKTGVQVKEKMGNRKTLRKSTSTSRLMRRSQMSSMPRSFSSRLKICPKQKPGCSDLLIGFRKSTLLGLAYEHCKAH